MTRRFTQLNASVIKIKYIFELQNLHTVLYSRRNEFLHNVDNREMRRAFTCSIFFTLTAQLIILTALFNNLNHCINSIDEVALFHTRKHWKSWNSILKSRSRILTMFTCSRCSLEFNFRGLLKYRGRCSVF